MLAGMPRERALACAVRLLDSGFFRIGSEDYAEENETYGVATMQKRHASRSTATR
jgi:DNA topoisomerase I